MLFIAISGDHGKCVWSDKMVRRYYPDKFVQEKNYQYYLFNSLLRPRKENTKTASYQPFVRGIHQ